MKKIAIFSGNRAEWGILFPIVYELNNLFEIDILLSGAHVIEEWNTKEQIYEQIKKFNISCSVIEIPLNDKGYVSCVGQIYDATIAYCRNNNPDIAIVLGDRVESFAFSVGVFYSQIPLIHMCGGDVVDVPNFDTNVRHSITKLATYHFVTSEKSKKVVLQMGEEEHRVINIGNPSFDYATLDLLTTRDEIIEKYNVKYSDKIAIFTFHPASMKDAETNFREFKESLDAVVKSNVDKVIITYPNNDLGYDMIIEYLKSMDKTDRITVVKSLGTFDYLSLMSNFDSIIIGNSSSGLLETAFFCVPVINIGDRQNNRVRGCNVIDVEVEGSKICTLVDNVCIRYDELKQEYSSSKDIFGNGNASKKALKYINSVIDTPKEIQLLKKFVMR